MLVYNVLLSLLIYNKNMQQHKSEKSMDLLSPTLWTGFSGAVFCYFIMAITPGPNNIILANAGLNFGYKRTIRLLIPVIIGINVFLLTAIFGFTSLFNKYKTVHVIVSVLGVMFLIYLGCKMALSKSTLKDNKRSTKNKPLSMFTLTLLQFSNIKAIMIAFSIASIYHKSNILDTYVFLFVVTLSAILVTGNTWIIFGSVLSKFLTSKRNAQIFNIIMGLTLVIYSLFLLPIDDIKTVLHI